MPVRVGFCGALLAGVCIFQKAPLPPPPPPPGKFPKPFDFILIIWWGSVYALEQEISELTQKHFSFICLNLEDEHDHLFIFDAE